MNDQDFQSGDSTKLLSLRNSKSFVTKQSTDKTNTNTDLIYTPKTRNSYGELSQNDKLLTSLLIFEPLDEEGERYLQEHMNLPPIDLTNMPSKYYINPHPTESIMSSSANSANEWWDKVDYSDEEVYELECVRDARKKKLSRKQIEKSEDAATLMKLDSVTKTFPNTSEMRQKRQARELQEREAYRAEIICKLEKKMVSLFNLKRQYQKTLGGDGCQRVRTSLPPLVAGERLTRQRDSLISRIKRKKFEDEVRRKKQIERKINIVRTLLNEQKQKEKEYQNKLKERAQLAPKKQKKTKDELCEVSLNESEKSSPYIVDTDSTTEIASGGTDFAQDDAENQFTKEEVPRSSEDEREAQIPTEGSKKYSTNKNSKKMKSLEKSPKKDGKTNKKNAKNVVAEVTEDSPAICEVPPELPASQLADLSLWFENWRENQREQILLRKEYEDQQIAMEHEVTLKPSEIVFKDVAPRQRVEKVVVVTNVGLAALQCRILGVHQTSTTETSPKFQTALSGPSKARTGQFWSLTVTLDTFDEVEDGHTEVQMLFCRGEVRTKLSIKIQILTPRAEPTLSNSNIEFGPQMFWRSGPFTKHLKISNPGGLPCLVYWTEVDDRPSVVGRIGNSFPTAAKYTRESEASLSEISEHSMEIERRMSEIMVKDIVKTILKNVFSVFRIDAQPPLILPPNSVVSLPVRFVPALSEEKGHVDSKFMFYFEGENLQKDAQELLVCGKIQRSPFRLEPGVINMKLCYAGGIVQQGRIAVYSSARHACQVVARVPRNLASVVSLVPSSTVVAAHSSVRLAVRLELGWDFLDKPCRYLDPGCGLLIFPITVWVTDGGAPGAPPLEATVIASVVPPCPLTLDPPELALGTVSTLETVSADLHLINHCPRTFTYAFVGLPKSITVEPGCGTGSILPLETVKLTLLFSPRAKDLGVDCERPGAEGEVKFTLRCFTTISLASPIQRKQPQKGLLSKQTSLIDNSSISSKYNVSMHISSKEATLHKKLEHSAEENKINEKRKVKFQENIEETISEESFVCREEIDDEEVYEEDYLIISEIKDDDHELDTEDLWNFYSSYKFVKGSKQEETVNDEKISETETNAVNEYENDLLENRSSNKDEVDKSPDEIDTDKDKNAKSVIEGEFRDELKEEITINENFTKTNSPKNEIKSELLENNFSIQEVDDVKSDSHYSGIDEEERCELDNRNMWLLPETCQRFASITVNAYVVDPLVELSSQAIVLPPTPCGSYSIAHIYLRSRPQKQCSVHERITKFKTRFSFQSPSKDLIVEPKQGNITYKQGQKIRIIYTPNLSRKNISDKALEMKVEYLKWKKVEEMLNELNKVKNKKKPKGKSLSEEEVDNKSHTDDGKSKKGDGKKLKGSVISLKTKKNKTSLKSSKKGRKKSSGPLPEVVIDPAGVEVTEEDLKHAEMTLLKYLEPYSVTLTLSCLLETEKGDGYRRQETLHCDVICSVVAPNIFLSTPACLDFGRVAVGTVSRMEATVTNLSFLDSLVRISTLNPLGPFQCPAHLECPFWKNGELELPPEHVLTIPVRFQPTEMGEVVEAFEVVSDSTIIHLQARGRGVPSAFSFLPDREVFMMTSAAGKKADVTILISNTCEAPLQFSIFQDYLKQGQSLPTVKPEASPETTSPKQKKEPKKDKKEKGLPEFTMLNEELENCLEKDFVEFKNTSITEPVFKIMTTDGHFSLLPGETKQITIRFTPPTIKEETSVYKNPKSPKAVAEKNKKEKSKTVDMQDTSTVKTSLSKKGGKKKQSLSGKKSEKAESVKSEIKDDVKTKQIFATKFSVVIADIRKVKDWVLLGIKK